jgi:5-formyltetrahydrofolate cyclo-ligase
MRGKPITRRTVLLRRDKLPEQERARASDAIVAQVIQLLARIPAGATIALYAPKGSEVDTTRIDAFARERPLRVAYPRIVEGDRRLAFYEATLGELAPGHFGILEPSPRAPAVALSELAAVIVPGLAFDRGGGRIGWGRGYYDATLVAAPSALRIGVAFECQLVDEVPREPHDARVHYVVTEATAYRAPAQS